MFLSPPNWQAYVQHLQLAWQQPVPFSPGEVNNIPNDERRGVYSFVVQPNIAQHPNCSYLMYVGKVEDQSFRDRYRDYLYERRQGENSRRVHVSRMLQKWDGFLWFCYAPVNNAALISQIEDELLAAYLPPANRRFPAKVRFALAAALAV
jgi:hypothetical protein